MPGAGKSFGRSETGSTAMTDATPFSEASRSTSSSTSSRQPPGPTLAPWFGLLSLAYMAPWTALGALVAYFKARHGPDFFVKLNCAYYLVGLPVALAQQWGDEALDARVGSARAYLGRNVAALAVAAAVLLALPLAEAEGAVLALVALLGAALWLAHGTATTLAAMFPPAALAWLQTGFRLPELYALAAVAVLDLGARPDPAHLRLFLHTTAALVLAGLGVWVHLVRHPATRALLKLKDQGGAGAGGVRASPPRSTTAAARTDKREGAPLLPVAAVAAAAPSCPLVRVPLTEAEKAFVDDVIRPCRQALFVTIASSVFVASFLAYVKSPNARRAYCICQALYFVRLFCDLAGRPLATLLPRPRWLASPASFLRAALARLLLAGLFFGYVGLPGFPQSDTLVTALVAAFSLLSGNVLGFG